MRKSKQLKLEMIFCNIYNSTNNDNNDNVTSNNFPKKWKRISDPNRDTLLAAGLGYTSASRVHSYTDQVGYVLVPVAVGRGHLTWILESQHLCHALKDRRSSILSGRPSGSNWEGLGISPGSWGTPFYGNGGKSRGIFWNARGVKTTDPP